MKSFEQFKNHLLRDQYDFDALLRLCYEEEIALEELREALFQISDIADRQPDMYGAICKICDKIIYGIEREE